MIPLIKTKIILIGACLSGAFILGRRTAPKPEIKLVENKKSIEQAEKKTKKEMRESMQKQVIRETHTVRNKSGDTKTDVSEFITYKKNTAENIDQNKTDRSQTSQKQRLDVKRKGPGIEYTIMVGQSLNDPKYDYLAAVGIPLFSGLKANVGYEFNNQTVFAGATFNF